MVIPAGKKAPASCPTAAATTVANADYDGDVEMTEPTTEQATILSDETMHRTKVTLAGLARRRNLPSLDPRRTVRAANASTPAISVEIRDATGQVG